MDQELVAIIEGMLRRVKEGKKEEGPKKEKEYSTEEAQKDTGKWISSMGKSWMQEWGK